MTAIDKNDQTDTPHKINDISLKNIILKIRELWHFLLSKWMVILLAGIIGGVAGMAYAWSKKTLYKAELSFALEDDKTSGGFGGALGLASQFGFDLGSSGGGAFSGDNLQALMKSRTIVEKTLLNAVTLNGKDSTLAELYIRFNKLRKNWETDAKLRNISFPVNADVSKFTLQQDSVLREFYNSIVKTNLTVDKTDKKLSIIDIEVTSENELFSKYFTELLARTVSDFYVDAKTKKSAQNVSILQRQTDSVRFALNAAITGVASSVDVNPNANPALQILKVPSQRRQVDVQANTAILSQLITNLELAKVTLRKETPLIQIIDRPILPLEKKKLGKLKSLILGGLIGGFLMSFLLLLRRLFKDLMNEG